MSQLQTVLFPVFIVGISVFFIPLISGFAWLMWMGLKQAYFAPQRSRPTTRHQEANRRAAVRCMLQNTYAEQRRLHEATSRLSVPVERKSTMEILKSNKSVRSHSRSPLEQVNYASHLANIQSQGNQ